MNPRCNRHGAPSCDICAAHASAFLGAVRDFKCMHGNFPFVVKCPRCDQQDDADEIAYELSQMKSEYIGEVAPIIAKARQYFEKHVKPNL